MAAQRSRGANPERADEPRRSLVELRRSGSCSQASRSSRAASAAGSSPSSSGIGCAGPVLDIAEFHDAVINYDSITGAFGVQMQVALVLGIVISSPVWLYQVFAFVTPAMKARESATSSGSSSARVPLFLVGCLSAG